MFSQMLRLSVKKVSNYEIVTLFGRIHYVIISSEQEAQNPDGKTLETPLR